MSGALSSLVGWASLAVAAPGIAASGEARPKPAGSAIVQGPPHVFGSIALPLKSTRFDDRWQQVLRSDAADGQVASLVAAARRAPKMEQLRLVNASLNQRIRYRGDGPSADHWSTVRETLGRSAGDCEDYVIAKLQALKALGVPESDLFMTIGHEGAAGAVHAVLVARIGRQFFVLDNRTNRLIPHEQFSGFYPIMTFGARSSWLHGYARGTTPAAVKARSVALQSSGELPPGNGSDEPPAMRR